MLLPKGRQIPDCQLYHDFAAQLPFVPERAFYVIHILKKKKEEAKESHAYLALSPYLYVPLSTLPDCKEIIWRHKDEKSDNMGERDKVDEQWKDMT